jgi:hypothetical protein
MLPSRKRHLGSPLAGYWPRRLYPFSTKQNRTGPLARENAWNAQILTQILLVIVGAEANSFTEITELSGRGHAAGRLLVDVDVDQAVDLSIKASSVSILFFQIPATHSDDRPDGLYKPEGPCALEEAVN